MKYTHVINFVFFFYFDYSIYIFLSVYSLLFDFTKYPDFFFFKSANTIAWEYKIK